MLIYKILLPEEWNQFESSGSFDGSPFDESSGFVHFSSRSQVVATAGRFFADVEMDTTTCRVSRGGRPIELTRTEYSLLELFLRNPQRVMSRVLIFESVWGYDFGPASNALWVYISYLRGKLESANEPRLIQTVRGL